MSQNGEASSSNATRPTVESDELQSLSEEQRRTVEKCTSIVHEFRAGQISKPRAALRLQQIIPHVDPDEESFLSIFEPYFDMLENFEQYRRGNMEQTNGVQQRLGESSSVAGQDQDNEHNERAAVDQTFPIGPPKRQRSLSTD